MNTALFVDKFYEMNPETDDLLAEGTELENGMIVLLEDSLMREDPERVDSTALGTRYQQERLREVNRWCEVMNFKVQRRFEHDDMGSVLTEVDPLVEFVALYSDGTKKKRRYAASYAWIVKKDSIPGNDGEQQVVVTEGDNLNTMFGLQPGYKLTEDDHLAPEGKESNHECKAEPKIVEIDGILHISCAECGDSWTTPKL